MATPNPFDDILYRVNSDEHIGKTLTFPDIIPVPFIDALPHLVSSSSTVVSPVSTAPSTLPSAHAATPLAWTTADLLYLLSALYPDQALADDLILEERPENPLDLFSRIKIELYLRVPAYPTTADAYSAMKPIGTGRPVSKMLVAHAAGQAAAQARKSLAVSLLKENQALPFVTTYYTLLSDLYALPLPSLLSVQRGIRAMGRISEREWMSRLAQVRGAGVDGAWGFEARLEAFLLDGGVAELGRWRGSVDMAVALGGAEREAWRGVYWEVRAFLGVVGWEVGV